jgi:hypothetical protein
MNILLKKIQVPATGLLVMGILNGITGLLILLSGLLRLAGNESLPTNSNERFGYLLSTGLGYGSSLLCLIASPLIVFGATKMMKGQSRKLGIMAAILSILPFTACCFLISSIFGIWALVVLMNSDVKAFFRDGGQQEYLNPPQPPKF